MIHHRIRAGVLENALLALARAQYAVTTLREADERCRSFNLEEVLDVWMPEWRQNSPPAQMGPMSHEIRDFSYCVFVGVWVEEVGFMLHHPESFPPKSVLAAFTTSDDLGRRAHLALHYAGQRCLVTFPDIPQFLLDEPRSHSFAEAREALVELIEEMVERVNLVASAVVGMAGRQ